VVTFGVDENGIMNVSALEKSTRNIKKVTVKNGRSRLSQADIDRMISDAEKFKAADHDPKKKVEARNGLES
jgi:L1 cell adhesion molecule like protein